MKILIPLFSPPTGTWGSLTRVLAVGKAAEARGHEVAFCTTGYLAERLEKLGYRVFRVPDAQMFGLPKPLSDAFSARMQEMTSPIPPGRSFGSMWLVLMMTGITRYAFLKKLVQSQLAAADAFKPNMIFTEVDLGAFLVSRIRGIPIACTFASVLKTGIGDFAWRAMKKSADRVLQDFGQAPDDLQEMLFGGDILKLIPSIPELERDIPATPDYVFTGSLLHSFRAASEQAFRPENGRRYVFVYMGTASVRLSAMRRVLPRVFPSAGSEGRPSAQCLVGSQSMTEELRIGNVVFRPFWDAESLMPYCDWVFCHGGHNTIIQSLSYNAPLLIFPGAIFERRFNAERVQAAGAGRMGEAPDFNQHWIAEAMRGREACAANAARLGEKIRSLGGPRTAVEAMEAWRKK